MLKRTSFRRSNASLNIFELWIGIAAILGSIFYFVSPESLLSAALAKQIGHEWLTFTWNGGYLLSGLMLVYGVLRPSPRIEIAGLWIVAATTAINGIAIAVTFGVRGASTVATYMTLAVASMIRARLIYNAAKELQDAV